MTEIILCSNVTKTFLVTHRHGKRHVGHTVALRIPPERYLHSSTAQLLKNVIIILKLINWQKKTTYISKSKYVTFSDIVPILERIDQ